MEVCPPSTRDMGKNPCRDTAIIIKKSRAVQRDETEIIEAKWGVDMLTTSSTVVAVRTRIQAE